MQPRHFWIAAAMAGLLAVTAHGSPTPIVKGELAFSETIAFDYDRDGTPDRVQFWVEFEGQPALAETGDGEPAEETGWASYFVLDVERQERIDDWLLGFNMGGGFPVAGEKYPLSNIRIEGRTAWFDLNGSTWRLSDRGEGLDQDSIRIDTGGRVREGRFFAGNITVIPDPRIVWEPADVEANSSCNGCHRKAAISIAAAGARHAEMPCLACHAEHPLEVPGAKPQCLGCHRPHTESLSNASCSTCHSSHDFASVVYPITVPDEYCVACHQESATQLHESQTRHMGLACVICHRPDHGAVPSCTDCHGGPHPQSIMSRPDSCAQCHSGAHQTRYPR